MIYIDYLIDLFQNLLRQKMISWRSDKGQLIALHVKMVEASFLPITVAIIGSSTLLTPEKSGIDVFEPIVSGIPLDP